MLLLWTWVCLLVLCIPRVAAFTEVFSITKDHSDNSYYAGNQESNFFIGKRNSACTLEWASTNGSTIGDNDNDENSEILYDVIFGRDALLYATGSTRGNFTSPTDELPNLDAAIVVYDPFDGRAVRQRQYDLVSGFDNIGRAIAEKPEGLLLVAVYGSPPNVDSSAVYQTLLLEINQVTLDVENLYSVTLTTTEIFPVSGGPKILDFIYDNESNSVVAVGHILGRGILWRYSLDSSLVTAQAEWGTIFGSYQISGFTTDGAGAFYVVGSSQERVLGNTDLSTTVSSQFHAYVIRYDDLVDFDTPATWVRQLDASGSSQSGMDIAIDPVTGALVVIGAFDADFEVTDSKTSQTFQVEAITDNGLTDVFIWVLEPVEGNFSDIRIVSLASTVSEDRANVVQVMSNRRIDIGGVINDGVDGNPLVCDESEVVSPSPSTLISPSPSATPTSSPTVSTSPSVSETPSSRTSVSSNLSRSPSPSMAAIVSVSMSPDGSTQPGSTSFGSPVGSPPVSPSIVFSTVSLSPSASALATATSLTVLPSLLVSPSDVAQSSSGAQTPIPSSSGELPGSISPMGFFTSSPQNNAPSSSPTASPPQPFISGPTRSGNISATQSPSFSKVPSISPQGTISAVSGRPVASALPTMTSFFSPPVLIVPSSSSIITPTTDVSTGPSTRPPPALQVGSLASTPAFYYSPDVSRVDENLFGTPHFTKEVITMHPIFSSVEPLLELSTGPVGFSTWPTAGFWAISSFEESLLPSIYVVPSPHQIMISPSVLVSSGDILSSPFLEILSPTFQPSNMSEESPGIQYGTVFPSNDLQSSPKGDYLHTFSPVFAPQESILFPSEVLVLQTKSPVENISKPPPLFLPSSEGISGSPEASSLDTFPETSSVQSTHAFLDNNGQITPSTEAIFIVPQPLNDLIPSSLPEPTANGEISPIATPSGEELPLYGALTSESLAFELATFQEPDPSNKDVNNDVFSKEPRPGLEFGFTESPEVQWKPSEQPQITNEPPIETYESPLASSSGESTFPFESPIMKSPGTEWRPLPGDALGVSPSVELVPSKLPEPGDKDEKLPLLVPTEEITFSHLFSATKSLEVDPDVSRKPDLSDISTSLPSESVSTGANLVPGDNASGTPDFESIFSRPTRPSDEGDLEGTAAPSKWAVTSSEEAVLASLRPTLDVSQNLQPSGEIFDLPMESLSRDPSPVSEHDPENSQPYSVDQSTAPEPGREGDRVLAESPAAEPSSIFNGMPSVSIEIYTGVSPLVSESDEKFILPTIDGSEELSAMPSEKPIEPADGIIGISYPATPEVQVTNFSSETSPDPSHLPMISLVQPSQFDTDAPQQPLRSEESNFPVSPLPALSVTPPVSAENEILPSPPRPPGLLEPSLHLQTPVELSLMPTSGLPEETKQPSEQFAVQPSKLVALPELGTPSPPFQGIMTPSEIVRPSVDWESSGASDSPAPSLAVSLGVSPSLDGNGTLEPSLDVSRETPTFLLEVSHALGASLPYILGTPYDLPAETFPFIVEFSMRPSPAKEIWAAADPSPGLSDEQLLPYQTELAEETTFDVWSPEASEGVSVTKAAEATVSVEDDLATLAPIESVMILPSANMSPTMSQTPELPSGIGSTPTASFEISPTWTITTSSSPTPTITVLPTIISQAPSNRPSPSVSPSSTMAPFTPLSSPVGTSVSPVNSPVPSSEELEPTMTQSSSFSPSVSGIPNAPSPSSSPIPTLSPISSPLLTPPLPTLVQSQTPAPSQSRALDMTTVQPVPSSSPNQIVTFSPSQFPSQVQSESASPTLLSSPSVFPSLRGTASVTVSMSPLSSVLNTANPEVPSVIPTRTPAVPSVPLLQSSLLAEISTLPDTTDNFPSPLTEVERSPFPILSPVTNDISHTPFTPFIDVLSELAPSQALTKAEATIIFSSGIVEASYTPVITQTDDSVRISPSPIMTALLTTASITPSTASSFTPVRLSQSPSAVTAPLLSSLSPSNSMFSSPTPSPPIQRSLGVLPPSAVPPAVSSTVASSVEPSLIETQQPTMSSIVFASISAVSSVLPPGRTPDTDVSSNLSAQPSPAPASVSPRPLQVSPEVPSRVPDSSSFGDRTRTPLPLRSAVASDSSTTAPTQEPLSSLPETTSPSASLLWPPTPPFFTPIPSPVASSMIVIHPTQSNTPEYELTEESVTPKEIESPIMSNLGEVPEISQTAATFEALDEFPTKTPDITELQQPSDTSEPFGTQEPFATPEASSLAPILSTKPILSPLLSISPPISVSLTPTFSPISSFSSLLPSPSNGSPSSGLHTPSLLVSTTAPPQSIELTSLPSPVFTPGFSPVFESLFPCYESDFVHDSSELLPTKNFQRVEMVIQVAGRRVIHSCSLTSDFVERFVTLSAINTQSNAALWFITLVEDGPAIYSGSGSSSLVTIERNDSSPANDTAFAFPTPTYGQGNRQLFPRSVVFHVTAYLEALSVGLAEGSYVEYVDTQNIVRRMKELGYEDIEWTGMIEAPRVLDSRTNENNPEKNGISAGAVSAISAMAAIVAGAAILVLKDGGVMTSTSNARPPLADMV